MTLSRSTPQSSEWNALTLDGNIESTLPSNGASAEPPALKDDGPSISVLFVCLGNICRSPMAEAVFRSLCKKHPRSLFVDSAGTGAYHTGDGPDPRAMSTLEDHGITDYNHAARKVQASDFTNFDYILAMDQENLHDLQRLKHRIAKKDVGISTSGMGEVVLFGDFGGKMGEVVGDPYYGARNGFEVAYEQMVRFSEGFIAQVLDAKK